MIATLTGRIDTVSGETCVIDVNGVGYLVYMALNSLEQLSTFEEKQVKLHIYYQQREDDVMLFGFLNIAEKDLFKKIIAVSGVGPKTALSLIGTLSADGFQEAVFNEDCKSLTNVPGIGLKTAQRLILELKGKVTRTLETSPNVRSKVQSIVRDAVDALEALGYPARDSAAAVETLYRENNALTTPELVRLALKNIGRK